MDSTVRVSGRSARHTVSSFHFLAPPEFFQVSFTRHTMGWRVLPPFNPSGTIPVSFWQHGVPYRDLLLWDNSGKRLSSGLAKVAGFSQRFPNIFSPLHGPPWLTTRFSCDPAKCLHPQLLRMCPSQIPSERTCSLMWACVELQLNHVPSELVPAWEEEPTLFFF